MAKKSFRSGFDLKKMLMIAAILVVVWVVFTSLKKEGFGLKEGMDKAQEKMNDMIAQINGSNSKSKKS